MVTLRWSGQQSSHRWGGVDDEQVVLGIGEEHDAFVVSDPEQGAGAGREEYPATVVPVPSRPTTQSPSASWRVDSAHHRLDLG
jgi:hypothetical protein